MIPDYIRQEIRATLAKPNPWPQVIALPREIYCRECGEEIEYCDPIHPRICGGRTKTNSMTRQQSASATLTTSVTRHSVHPTQKLPLSQPTTVAISTKPVKQDEAVLIPL